jgi:hypothetical protein
VERNDLRIIAVLGLKEIILELKDSTILLLDGLVQLIVLDLNSGTIFFIKFEVAGTFRNVLRLVMTA